MASSTRESQDQRNDNGTEDPNMTIEFLRARLLSERSVSRAARQRADGLAKRVIELEEQLKIVSLQRKKAEKATANVLAILENHGISDASEEFDSSSGQDETINDSNNPNYIGNGEETSTSIRVTDTPVYSSSEIDSSPSTVRSLSWKSGKHSPNSFRENKYKDSARRKFTSSAPDGSLPKRIGKSCRRNRRREIRSAVEGLEKDSSSFLGDAPTARSEDLPDCSDSKPQTLGEDPHRLKQTDSLEDPLLGMSANQGQEADSNFCTGSVGYEDMEGALQHQEQLIGRYEAEEKAQREWEEKFKENNSCSPDSYDPGNHSDVTEERDDAKTTGQPCAALSASAPVQDSKSEEANICSNKESKTLENLLLLPNVDISIQERECSNNINHEPLAPDFGLSRGISHPLQPENHNHASSSHYHFAVPSSHVESVNNDSQKSISSGNRCQVSAVPHEAVNSVGLVLEALQQAKSSLKQKFDESLLVAPRSSGMAIESFIPVTKTPGKVEIPAGCPGLFRLPIDMQFETISEANFLGRKASRLSLSSYSPEEAGDKSYSSLYLQPKSSVSASEKFRTISSSSAEGITGAQMKKASEPTIGADLPSSTRFGHLDLQGSSLPFTSKLMYPSYPFYPDVTAQLPFSGGSRTSLDNKDVGLHPTSPLSLHDDHKFLLPGQNRLSINDDQKVGLPPSKHLSFNDHINPNLYR